MQRRASARLFSVTLPFSYARRIIVWAIIFSLALPLPMAGSVAQAAPASARNGDDGAAHVHARLNSPERAAAVAEAVRKDAELQAFGTGGSTSARETATATPAPSATAARTTQPEQRQAAVASPRPAAVAAPKSLGQVLMEQTAAFMGVPGPVGLQQDEGLGFHQDGTVRKAGGADSASGYDGKRAASYAAHGMGYGPYGSGGMGYGYNNGMHEPGYDPVTGFNFRYGDGTAGGRITNGMGRGMDGFDPFNAALNRGLSYGLGIANSAGEAALSSLVDGGRARLNFSIDLKGRINGEGDVLYPFWDSQYTTVYTQLGARSMSGMQHGGDDGEGADRWIGNAGLGQRWFPFAESLTDAGNLMLGYNVFFDYDFTRSHQRGGFGIEAQYDWIRLASNYYFPISSWRDSKDFDGDFVKERPAQGWDVRAKGYMPFYRNLAVTGAYSQWYGDHVGMFSSDKLEKDPRVWSYGLEYTPVPLVSAFVNQRSTERGRDDTEFGLRFTYHFQMPWEDQISHSKVAELRTVTGSKHEFVDRENRIILEYKAKNSYKIEYVGPDGNGFLFRVRDGFGKYVAGQTVRVTTSGMYLAEAAPAEPPSLFARALDFLDDLISVKAAYAAGFTSKTYVTDGQGRFWVQLDASAPNPTMVTVQAGDNSQNFALAGGGAPSGPGITLVSATNGADFVGGASTTASIVVKVTDASGATVANPTITWSLAGSTNNSPAVVTAYKAANTYYGLAWGAAASGTPGTQLSGNALTTTTTVQLTDVVGERSVTVKAEVTVNGTVYFLTQAVTFGNGPLSKMRLAAPAAVVQISTGWQDAVNQCGGTATNAALLTTAGYISTSNLPDVADLLAVTDNGNAAGYAAGWTITGYWSGRASSSTAGSARIVTLTGGENDRLGTNGGTSFLCKRP